MGDSTQVHLAHSNWSGIQQTLSKRTAADLLFVCRDGQVATHRLLLIHRSEVLMGAFDKENSCMNKIKFSFEPTTVILPDFAKRDVANLISLLYTGQVDFGEIGDYNSLLQVVEALKLDFGELNLKINTGFNPAKKTSLGLVEADMETASICSEVANQNPSEFVQVKHNIEKPDAAPVVETELFTLDETTCFNEDSNNILGHSIFDSLGDGPVHEEHMTTYKEDNVIPKCEIEKKVNKNLDKKNSKEDNGQTFHCNLCQFKAETAKSFKFHLAMKHAVSLFNLGRTSGWFKKDDETDNFLCLLCKDSVEPRSKTYTGTHLGIMHNKVFDLMKPREAKKLKDALKKSQKHVPEVKLEHMKRTNDDPSTTTNDPKLMVREVLALIMS